MRTTLRPVTHAERLRWQVEENGSFTTTYIVIMPALGHTPRRGKILKWLKYSGVNVTKGEALVEVETAKATMEVDALAEYHHQLGVGEAAKIRAVEVRKQKTDARDALHLLDLILQGRFPKIWIPSSEERDRRPMLRNRNKLVAFRTSVENQLHALAMSQSLCRKSQLWTKRRSTNCASRSILASRGGVQGLG